MAFLEIKNFNKTFSGNVKALDDINLTLEKGKVLSIIGHSGSGKTTLLRCINFLELADNGVMTLEGEVLYDSAVSKNLNDGHNTYILYRTILEKIYTDGDYAISAGLDIILNKALSVMSLPIAFNVYNIKI